MKKKLLFVYNVFLLATLLCSGCVYSQKRQQRDSVYQKIENFSKKRKVSKFLYGILFRNVSDAAIVPTTTETPEDQYNGKHIRNIIINTYDPLGYNKNMEQKQTNWYDNFGNFLHNKTKNFTVRGYLLFKKGDEYNAQKLYESERILRDTRFISRVSIRPIESSVDRDSVDIAVKVLDSWSLQPLGSFSGKRMGVGLAEYNFLGLGHTFGGIYRTNFKTKQSYRMIGYSANNIYGTYINAGFRGEKDFEQNENVYVMASRDFVSPLTRWAGGIRADYYRHLLRYPTELLGDVDKFPIVSVKAHNQEAWGGYQWRLQKPGSDQVTDNIAVTAGVRNFVYVDTPETTFDPGGLFQSHNLYLASVGFTQRKFNIKKNIFNYELPEDIPYGALFSITSGAMKQRNYPWAAYFGATAGYGAFTDLGYFNYRLQYGTYIRERKNYQSTFRFDGTYFSPLRENGKVNLRHFFSHTLVLGSKRDMTYADRINLSDRTEFPQFSNYFMGKDKFILRYQLQSFINKSWKNFQINPYFITAVGWMNADGQPLFKSKAFTKFGLGVHFYNPYLAFNRFQISLVYYPKVPFDGSGFDFNEYKNYYFPINTFRMEAPQTVAYSDWR